MLSIKEILKGTLNTIAKEHGIIIKTLSVSYINVSTITSKEYIVDRINIDDAFVIKPEKR